jgi:hypothetical protein
MKNDTFVVRQRIVTAAAEKQTVTHIYFTALSDDDTKVRRVIHSEVKTGLNQSLELNTRCSLEWYIVEFVI